MGDNILQHSFIEQADSGYFYIRNGHSNKYMSFPAVRPYLSIRRHGHFQPAMAVRASQSDADRFARHPLQNEQETFSSAPAPTTAPTSRPAAYANGNSTRPSSSTASTSFVTLPSNVTDSGTSPSRLGQLEWRQRRQRSSISDVHRQLHVSHPRSADNTMHFAITTDSNNSEQILETDQLPAGQSVPSGGQPLSVDTVRPLRQRGRHRRRPDPSEIPATSIRQPTLSARADGPIHC